MLVNRWGWSRVKRLPAHPFVVTGEGGLDPEDAADLFGFSSGDALLTALEDVVTEPMQQVIGAETDRRMVAAEGEVLTDGRLPDVAAVAVFNADRDAVIRTELQALETQRRTAPPTAAETHAAGERTPEEHAAAERAYERRWMEAEAKLRIAIAQGYQQVKIDALRATVRELKAAAVTARQERVYERRWFDAEAKLAAAQAAKASQAELAVLDAEVKQLRQRARSGAATIQKAMPSADALRQMALERIARTRVQDLDPRRYWMDARRAGQQAIAAAATQDFPAAIAAKQHELVNVTLFRVASQAKAEVEKRAAAAKALGSPASRARLALAGGGYQDQIDGVLDRYQFAKVSQKALDRRVALRLWIAGLESTGQTVTLPDDIIDDARRIHYRELTVEQLRGVTDGLTMLAHLATLKNTLLKAADKRAFEDLRDALADSIRTNNTARAKALEFPQGGEKWRAAADWFASHAKLSLFVSQLDGNVDGGPMWQAFARPINAAADQEEARNIATGKAYYALVDQFYPGREQLAFGELLHIPAIGASLTKEARLSVLQNWGTETGRDRVLSDPERQWTQPQIEAIIDTLDERDTQFVQAHWDFLQTFWPEIAAKQKRLTGLEPEKVEALEVTTKFGTLRGGYHPLMYDYRLNARAGQLAAAADAKQAVSAAYVQTTTKRGFVETRKTHVELPIRYELGVGIQHLGQVIHDLTHHEMLIDTTRLLRDSTIAKAILETRGDIVYGKLTRLLEDIALGDRARGGKATIAEKGANWLRSRSQVVGLAYNLWTSIQQPLGLFNGMDRVGVKWVARGAKRWLRDAASMENTLKWIVSVSPMMANRASSGNVDLRDVRQALREPGGWFDRLVRTVSADTITQQTIHDSYTYLIGAAQRIADVPTWLGEYEKQMHAHPGDEARAIALADQAVLDSQGGGQIKDLAEAQRGGPIAKLFMTYAAYSLTVLNASARAAGRTDFRSPASTLTFMGHVSLLYIMPALLTEILRCGVGRATCDDPLTFIEKVGGEILGTALNGVIYVREAASSVKVALNLDPGVRGYEGPAASRPFQILAQLAQQVRQHEVDGALEKAAFAAAGVIWRFPAAQVQRSVDGWIALQEDRTDNPLAVVFGPPPKRQAN
jgi:hypothetical protein